ncbi:XRE family transcriptional regulator [Neglecta sp. X4]|uniref:helix-turn-helix domain-containing protein n=1 Tax=unclassified Neglectibacter TaxID=2632164 RepID=UPI00136CEF16|nr:MULTISPECIES: helix-turn-helix transcriptional regulator [unclassified Neglectibacter]NBI17953.1 XRE family transcriptional regulator [Neglectibacter sp. 59]NBJ73678.1 XRE family transcriptional regulator [Neglectibacter sp. X4]NCE81413.1 XRE family transcriptional regulator [Neglectibacter sp. X58]
MVISEVVKNIRSQLSLSQEGLARELHMGFTSVNRWENNKSKPNQIARHALVELCKKNNLDQELIEALEAASQVKGVAI